MYSNSYYDGYRAGQNNKPYRAKADSDWRMGWTDAQAEKTYDGTLDLDLIDHYEDDY